MKYPREAMRMSEETGVEVLAPSAVVEATNNIDALAHPERYPSAIYFSKPRPVHPGPKASAEAIAAYEDAKLDYAADALHMQGKGDFKASATVNEKINLVHILAHRASVRNEDETTGEITYQPIDRIVLLDDEGRTYEAASGGLFQSVRTLLELMGQPHTWTRPVPVVIKSVAVRGSWHTFKLEIWREKGKK